LAFAVFAVFTILCRRQTGVATTTLTTVATFSTFRVLLEKTIPLWGFIHLD